MEILRFHGNDLGGHSGHGGSIGHILYNDCTGSYARVVSNMHIFHNAHIWANSHVVAYRGRSAMVSANVEELAQIHIVSYNGMWIHYHAYTVSEIESIADFTLTRNLHKIFGR